MMHKVNNFKNLNDMAKYLKAKTHIKIDYNQTIEKTLNSNDRE